MLKTYFGSDILLSRTSALGNGSDNMQSRMKKHQLSQEEMESLLLKCQTGTLATINQDGTPYCVPVHYVLFDNAIYLHGLPAGQKLDNLKANSNVCLNVYELQGFLLDPDEKPCDTNTAYHSVVIQGKAELLSDIEKKKAILAAIVRKYTLHLAEKEIPLNMLNGTAVIKVSIIKQTGKYYS